MSEHGGKGKEPIKSLGKAGSEALRLRNRRGKLIANSVLQLPDLERGKEQRLCARKRADRRTNYFTIAEIRRALSRATGGLVAALWAGADGGSAFLKMASSMQGCHNYQNPRAASLPDASRGRDLSSTSRGKALVPPGFFGDCIPAWRTIESLAASASFCSWPFALVCSLTSCSRRWPSTASKGHGLK